MFLWYNIKEKSSKASSPSFSPKMSAIRLTTVEEHYCDQVSPASLVRLIRIGGVNEGISSEGMSERNRKRVSQDAPDSLITDLPIQVEAEYSTYFGYMSSGLAYLLRLEEFKFSLCPSPFEWLSGAYYEGNVWPNGGMKILSTHQLSGKPARRLKVTCSLSDSNSQLNVEKMVAKLRDRLFHREVEISPSSYDNAWMAMVPARESSSTPCFPQCLDWIMENQNPNGSWGLQHPSLLKDSLSCTLACLLALRKWNVAPQLVQTGLQFIGSYGWAIVDKAQYTPIGFEIVFPKMISYASELNLSLPLDLVVVEHMIKFRDSAIQRNQNLEYVAEGLGDSWNWNLTISSSQTSNGSLFNSPATTAAALIHAGHDDKCFQYLLSLLTHFKTACVPTMYPFDVYTSLCTIDTLERLGVKRHFQFEIDNILEETYRLWQRKDEQLFTDITCRAMAFRLLRISEYLVSSDELAEFVDQEQYLGNVSLQFTNVPTILELNRASQLRIHEGEVVLEKIHAWTSTFLKLQLQNGTILDNQLAKQVESALKSFSTTLDRLESRSSIELYNVHHFQTLKAAYRCHTITNEDILQLSREDFNICQAQYQNELGQLERWYVDIGLNKCNFGREVVQVSIFTAVAIIPDPNLSDARMYVAQTCALIARVDDFLDLHASDRDALHFIERVKKWSLEETETSSSPQVEILFAALYKGVNKIAENASIKQGRCVKHILIDMWRELMIYGMMERGFTREHRLLLLDDYLSVSWVTIGLKVIVHSALLLEVKVSDDSWTGPECTNLCKHASILIRLLNDLQSFKRETQEENSVGQLIAQSNGTMSEEEAVSKIRKICDRKMVELSQMVYATEGNVIPKEYKEICWRTSKFSYYLYSEEDGFSITKKFTRDMNALIYQPIIVPPHPMDHS